MDGKNRGRRETPPSARETGKSRKTGQVAKNRDWRENREGHEFGGSRKTSDLCQDHGFTLCRRSFTLDCPLYGAAFARLSWFTRAAKRLKTRRPRWRGGRRPPSPDYHRAIRRSPILGVVQATELPYACMGCRPRQRPMVAPRIEWEIRARKFSFLLLICNG